MTSITFLDKPNVLVFKIKDDSVTANSTILDYSESDFVFPILDKWIDQGNDFEYIFSDGVLVIPDPRPLTNHKEYKAYFGTDMLSTSTNGEWFACFGITQKNKDVIIVGNIQLDQLLHLNKHFKIKNNKNQYLQIKYM
ncbi:hypothetical protein [Streptococcus parauberis]|uniref:hypothetical protein n=1 Tax=Streptococcus parauberis TaxID=1348 RepID=UPI000C1CAA23|nr:hypothetical protein [Streptococcus parauberis]PIO78097.1 hypothetical protein ADO05_01900 [Streptococcus parauberis]POS68388.1 hypothetical protein AOS90_00068 [Streptococcus parauberis]